MAHELGPTSILPYLPLPPPPSLTCPTPLPPPHHDSPFLPSPVPRPLCPPTWPAAAPPAPAARATPPPLLPTATFSRPPACTCCTTWPTSSYSIRPGRAGGGASRWWFCGSRCLGARRPGWRPWCCPRWVGDSYAHNLATPRHAWMRRAGLTQPPQLPPPPSAPAPFPGPTLSLSIGLRCCRAMLQGIEGTLVPLPASLAAGHNGGSSSSAGVLVAWDVRTPGTPSFGPLLLLARASQCLLDLGAHVEARAPLNHDVLQVGTISSSPSICSHAHTHAALPHTPAGPLAATCSSTPHTRRPTCSHMQLYPTHPPAHLQPHAGAHVLSHTHTPAHTYHIHVVWSSKLGHLAIN